MQEWQFSEQVLRVLRTAGWDETRITDVENVETLLRSRGFQVSPLAHDFLQSFHGLTVDVGSCLIFDVPRLLDWMGECEPPYLPGLIGKPLCPVGEVGRCYMLLAPDGEVVYLLDEWLCYFRHVDIAEAFEASMFSDSCTAAASIDIADEKLPPPYRATPSG
jgi:hypothetical protein